MSALREKLLAAGATRVEEVGAATLILADCLAVLPVLPKVDCVVTDPVWPNCPPGLYAGSNGEQHALLASALASVEATRIVVVLGFDSDPRFLSAVPAAYPFVRSQQLPYAFPAYSGRLLRGDEVAYVFGAIPKGRGVIPGRARAVASHKADRQTGHPSPRADDHMEQLVGWWSCSGETVVDPFMGTGATAIGASRAGRRFIGVEICERYFSIALERITNAQRQERLFA